MTEPRYREELPDGCPPSDAMIIREQFIVFRLVEGDNPTPRDFDSQRALKPHARFNVCECRARGVSVFTDPADLLNVKRTQRYRNRRRCRVSLGPGAGKIKNDSGRGSHHCWWPYAEYDILTCCEVLAT